jgi:hypothetical protein
MAGRSSGGIIGSFNLSKGITKNGVFQVTEAADLNSIGQFPGGSNMQPQIVAQIGNIVKPTISSLVYTNDSYVSQNSAANATTSTGASLRILGSNFAANTSVFVNGSQINTTNKFVNSGEIRTANIVLPNGSYPMAVFNGGGVGNFYPNLFTVASSVTWVTGPTLTGGNINTPISITLSATSPTTVTYSSSNLPAGLSLDSSAGVLSGSISTAGTYVFSVTATNSYGLSSTQTFSINKVP